MLNKIIKYFVPWADQSNKINKYYKKAHYFINHGNMIFAKELSYRCFKKYGCIISPKATIGKNLLLPHPIGVVIGEGVIIGDNVYLFQNVTIGRKNKDIPEYPTIGDNVVIYANSVIAGNVKIGNNAIIGCNSVVLRDVKEGEVVAGIVK